MDDSITSTNASRNSNGWQQVRATEAAIDVFETEGGWLAKLLIDGVLRSWYYHETPEKVDDRVREWIASIEGGMK